MGLEVGRLVASVGCSVGHTVLSLLVGDSVGPRVSFFGGAGVGFVVVGLVVGATEGVFVSGTGAFVGLDVGGNVEGVQVGSSVVSLVVAALVGFEVSWLGIKVGRQEEKVGDGVFLFCPGGPAGLLA